MTMNKNLPGEHRISGRSLPTFAFGWFAVFLASAFFGSLVAQERVTDSTAPNALAAVDGWVYWGITPSEQCGAAGASQGELLRVRGGGGADERLGVGCRLNPIAVESDGHYVFYLNWAASSVESKWVGGGSATVVVDDTIFGFKPGGLAIDASHVYWADTAGIRRVPKEGGAVEMVVAGVDAESIEVDGQHVYWSEGSYSVSRSGRLRRILKDGSGPVETLVSGREGPPQIAIDATHVYWTGTDAEVWMWPKDGSVVATRIVAGEAGFRASGIILDDTHVFWSDGAVAGFTGRVRRVAKGGGRIDNLVIGSITRPRALRVDGAFVYYSAVESARGAGIYRLLRDADAVLDNLELVDVEITQGIQSLQNDVTLIEDKSTLVRVWASAERADTPNVECFLYGTRGGAALPGSPLRSVLPSMSVHRNFRVGENEREHLDSSFNFFLPADWASGQVRLTARINPDETIPERTFSDDTWVQIVTFESTPEMCIVTVPVRTKGTGVYGPRSLPFLKGIERFRTLWPISDVEIWSQSDDIAELEVCWTDTLIPVPYPCYGPYELSSDGGKVLNALSERRFFSFDPDGCSLSPHYVGLVRATAPPRTKGGRARTPGQYAWVRIQGGTSFTSYHADQPYPYFPAPPQGITLAHELAHNHGQKHVDCGRPDSPDRGYPYCFDSCPSSCPCCGIDNSGPREHYGFDFLTQRVLPPGSVNSYMGYGDPRWVSDYHWERLFSVRNSFGAAPAAGDGGADGIVSEWLFVTGRVNELERTGEIELVYRIDTRVIPRQTIDAFVAQQREQDGGKFDYVLRLVDSRGSPQVSESFRLASYVEEDPPEEPGDRGFSIVVPWSPRTATVRLVQGGQQIATKDAGGNPPTVRVLQPNGGEVIGDSLVVRWEASDPDGEVNFLRPLYYVVQLSPDGGRSWQALTTNLTVTELVIDDASDVPGSKNALVRVIATDGFNTANDTSDGTFVIKDRRPTGYILHPEDGATYEPGEQIFVAGTGWDPEDGTLDGTAMVWSVGGQDITRSGRRALLPGLPPGVYRITLSARDMNGLSDTESVDIIVAFGGGLQRPGDMNQDASLDISDAVGVLNFLFLGGNDSQFLPCGDGTSADPANVQLLDSNGDRRLDLSDPVYVLRFLFTGGPPPVLGTGCVRISDCPDNSPCP